MHVQTEFITFIVLIYTTTTLPVPLVGPFPLEYLFPWWYNLFITCSPGNITLLSEVPILIVTLPLPLEYLFSW